MTASAAMGEGTRGETMATASGWPGGGTFWARQASLPGGENIRIPAVQDSTRVVRLFGRVSGCRGSRPPRPAGRPDATSFGIRVYRDKPVANPRTGPRIVKHPGWGA